MTARVLRLAALLGAFALGGCAASSKAKSGAVVAEDETTPDPMPMEELQRHLATEDPILRETFARAIDLGLAGDDLKARDALERLVAKHPKLDAVWTNLGVLYEREQRLADAERAYRKALEVRADQPAAWECLARLYCRLRRPAKIEAELRARVRQKPSVLAPRVALAQVLLHQNRVELAATEAKKVLKSDERHVRAMQVLAAVYYRQRKLELAKLVLENARAVDPKDASTHNALGLVSMALEAKPSAADSFKRAIELRPDFIEAKINHGAMLNEAEDFEGAVGVLETAVAAAPELVAARVNLGNAYRGRQQVHKALAQYKQAQQLAPKLADIDYNLALLHLDQDLPEMDAQQRFEAALFHLAQFEKKGGVDAQVQTYVRDANKGIEREKRRREREQRDALKKAAEDARRRLERGNRLGEGDEPVSPAAGEPPADDANPNAGPKPTSGKLAGEDK